MLLESERVPEYFEEVPEELKAQSSRNETLKIENLKKVYSNGTVAVKDLDLELYTN